MIIVVAFLAAIWIASLALEHFMGRFYPAWTVIAALVIVSPLPIWRDRLFSLILGGARRVSDFFFYFSNASARAFELGLGRFAANPIGWTGSPAIDLVDCVQAASFSERGTPVGRGRSWRGGGPRQKTKSGSLRALNSSDDLLKVWFHCNLRVSSRHPAPPGWRSRGRAAPLAVF